jgi:hypothetical protein
LRRKERHWKPYPPNKSIPQKRGRPRKNKETGEAQAPSEPRAKSVVEELLMRAIQLEPVEGPSRETCDRRRRPDTEGTNIREPSQQLKKVQLAIAELYQENRELRQQLAEKTLEASTSQGREGNVTWLKRQLREAQDTIIQLREAQRMSEERIVEHFKECGPAMENVHAALASVQKRLKGNTVLQRQVMNLKRRNWSLRRTLRISKLQTRPEA